MRIEGGRETARAVGWNRDEWRALTGIADLGADLPENRPGCGSRTVLSGQTTSAVEWPLLDQQRTKAGSGARRVQIANDP